MSCNACKLSMISRGILIKFRFPIIIIARCSTDTGALPWLCRLAPAQILWAWVRVRRDACRALQKAQLPISPFVFEDFSRSPLLDTRAQGWCLADVPAFAEVFCLLPHSSGSNWGRPEGRKSENYKDHQNPCDKFLKVQLCCLGDFRTEYQ